MENLKILAEKFNNRNSNKEYTLSLGTIPNSNSKALPFNPHTLVIAKAIENLVENGIEKASKDTIMEKAVSLGLYEVKASKSNPSYIFSWWLSSLKATGFIAKD